MEAKLWEKFQSITKVIEEESNMANINIGCKSIRSSGRTSRLVCLPQIWIKNLEVASGDRVIFFMKPNGDLILRLIENQIQKESVPK